MSLATWARDLALGARFAVIGGRPGLLRTLLTATGVGFGVALLLTAVSLPNMTFQREVRESQRAVDGSELIEATRPDSFLHLGRSTVYRDDVVTGLLVRPEGDAPPAPPGTAKLPALGEMAVSPRSASCSTPPKAPSSRSGSPTRSPGRSARPDSSARPNCGTSPRSTSSPPTTSTGAARATAGRSPRNR